MENISELKREAEEIKERVTRDIEDIREMLRRIAEEARQSGSTKTQEAVQGVERWIGGATRRVERSIEKALALIAESSLESGGLVTREMDFSDFSNVEVSHAFNVEVARSDSHRVAISASDRLFDFINITKSGNTLRISLKPLPFQIRPTLEARIAMPVLNKLRLAGATRGTVRGFSSQNALDVNLSGAGTLDIDMEAGETRFEVSGASRLCGTMKAGAAEFVLSGASRAKLAGSAHRIALSAWGASTLDLGDFAANDGDVHLKGASQAVVNVSGELDLDLSGCSRLRYAGSPTMRDVSLSGASTLSQR